ncbi:hypothetical protein FRB99_007398 [Tulasnella sp. 403]|nr:hypothetical protein FRB99_007398 [Tulasnella sp. 403]
MSKDTKSDYEYSGCSSAPQKFIHNCSCCHFEQVVNEMCVFIAKKLSEAKLFAKQLMEMLMKPESDNNDEVAADKLAVKGKKEDLDRVKDNSDTYQQILRWLNWAPKITNDLDDCHYTWDLGVFVLDKAKFQKNFKGSYIYLTGKFSPNKIKAFFYPNITNLPTFEYPTNHLYRLLGCVNTAGLDGQKTNLTFSCFSELEAYMCNEFEKDSWEVAVLNFNKQLSNFSAKGDSGSCIFNAEGEMVTFLHSRMPRGMSNHIMFSTPAHYIIKLIIKHYPDADFFCKKF